MAIFNGVELTEASIQTSRQWFADNARACIKNVRSGKTTVNNPESYFEWRENSALDSLAGSGDHTLAFLQRAYFIQTGKSVALLP